MKLLCASFEQMVKMIKRRNANLIMFGAGVIGQIVTPEILKDHNVLQYVDCYLDNNETKWGETIDINGMGFEIRSLDYLDSCPPESVLLINVSRFSDVVSQLEQMRCTRQMICYIMPMMLIHNYCSEASDGSMKLAGEPLIPKKLHYMWLGGKPLSESLKSCIESWRQYCPDYEIVEWNENNYDIAKHPYMKQAYEAKAYGFVPDYARLDILYREGGLYLDTDVELKRNIDDMLYQEAFCGVEKWQIINMGGMSGAVKGHPMIKKLLEARDKIYFIDSGGKLNKNTCGFYDTRTVIKEGYRINGKTQSVRTMNIYAYDYFHPYDYMSGILKETRNTHSIHWFNGGWLDEKLKRANEESKRQYMELYRRAIEKDYIN